MYQFLLLQSQHFYFIIGEPHSVENECYEVLGGGVTQSIELKDNAAYSSVSAQCSSQPVHSNGGQCCICDSKSRPCL